MALHPNFPNDFHAILNLAIRWFPADEAYREKRADQLTPPLVSSLPKTVRYASGTTDSSVTYCAAADAACSGMGAAADTATSATGVAKRGTEIRSRFFASCH